jgi:serine O-acetyltransferase
MNVRGSILASAEKRGHILSHALTRAPLKYDGDTIKAWAGDSQWRAFRADLARFRKHGYSGWGSEGFWALVIHRLQNVVRRRRSRWLWMPIRLTLQLVNKLFTMVTHTNIHPDAQIGPGLLIPNVGLRVHGNTKIGADCTINHICTIGAGPRAGGATIGDHVVIGCHSCIIGAVTIGDGAMVAPNSLVISDVPAGATAMGVPARISGNAAGRESKGTWSSAQLSEPDNPHTPTVMAHDVATTPHIERQPAALDGLDETHISNLPAR